MGLLVRLVTRPADVITIERETRAAKPMTVALSVSVRRAVILESKLGTLMALLDVVLNYAYWARTRNPSSGITLYLYY